MYSIYKNDNKGKTSGCENSGLSERKNEKRITEFREKRYTLLIISLWNSWKMAKASEQTIV